MEPATAAAPPPAAVPASAPASAGPGCDGGPLPSAARPATAASASFTCGRLRAVSALLAPRRRLLLPVAVAVSSEFDTEDAEGEQSEGEGGGDSEAEYSEDLKVFVGNLPFTIDNAQLAGLFEQAGSVEMVV
ncbi:RNA-binding protein CP29B, chloroplastic [Hordeum vulgare]|nr:RNA-binding protein CP29B, chloroplastic [Hordeum vulgare]